MMNVMCKTQSDDYVEESGDNVHGIDVSNVKHGE
jgi:hypothetical protein